MESNSKTARPYALAAFKQAEEEGRTAEWAEMLNLLVTVVSDPLMGALIVNPNVTNQQLAELVMDVCGDGLSPTGQNFVRILCENRRLGVIRDVAEIYHEARARKEKRADVVVSTAYALTPAQQNTINVAMTRRLGSRVDLRVEIDPGLIGGVVIRSGDTVIDASIRGQLEQLAQSVA